VVNGKNDKDAKGTKDDNVKPDPLSQNLPDRVFVVQFRDRMEPGAARLSGRAEHVMSGENTDFETPEELVGFFGRVMKPLFDAVEEAMARDGEDRTQRLETLELRTRLETLSPPERRVLALLVTGLLNKQIASELGTTDQIVKGHRGRVMRKMGAGFLADLVRMSEKLKSSPEPVFDQSRIDPDPQRW
jgi:DNA-binding CsgD family transcriptional regulator